MHTIVFFPPNIFIKFISVIVYSMRSLTQLVIHQAHYTWESCYTGLAMQSYLITLIILMIVLALYLWTVMNNSD